jgi:hypothetical protein
LKCSTTAANRCSLTGTTVSIAAGQTFSVQISGVSVPGVPMHFRVRVH